MKLFAMCFLVFCLAQIVGGAQEANRAASAAPQPSPQAQPSTEAVPRTSPTPECAPPPPQPITQTTPAAQPSPVTKKAAVPRYLDLGRSARGRTITATVYGKGKRVVMVLGGIHGDEPKTSILARALIATLGRDDVPDGLTVLIVPDVNPDGLMSLTRVNARGVDINRNFPSPSWRCDYPDGRHYPGSSPASESETRAIIKFIERYPPDYVITLHAALGCVNWDGPAADLANVIAPVNGYPLCQSLGYETPGSLGTYTGTDRQIPTVTIELRDSPAGEIVQENLPALRALLAHLASVE